jgi:hypothetical protein
MGLMRQVARVTGPAGPLDPVRAVSVWIAPSAGKWGLAPGPATFGRVAGVDDGVSRRAPSTAVAWALAEPNPL